MLILCALLVLPSSYFPFVIPWDDASKGTATDVSFLNTMPAGKNGRIIVRDGHFVEAKTGKSVRFLGTNMGAKAAFPSHEDAEKIAGRLAKLGFNIVRMHHLQNDWDREGGMIWKADKIYQELDPKQLDKLDYFVYALKKHGIYTNMNLTTTRRYLPEMGFPESVKDIKFEFAKKIDKVNRRMIELQKQYAKDLMGRKNPYTGLLYKDDPALAVVEINNENSLVGWPGESPGAGLSALPEPFKSEVTDAWNAWLRKRYAASNLLLQAWSRGVTPRAPSIIAAGNRWTYENQSNGDVTMSVPEDYRSTRRVARPMRLQINSNNGPDWHVQTHLVGLNLEEEATYTLRFKAKSDKQNTIRASVTLDEADWSNLGLDQSIEVGPEEKVFELSFVARGTRKNHSRVAFAMGSARGNVEISDLSLSPGLRGEVLPPGASLAAGNFPLPEGGTKVQLEDYTQFLLDTERAYGTEMRSYLRTDLGFKSNMIDTQISWGSLTGILREEDSEFADNHAYWQHPSFGNGGWNPTNWSVNNVPMVNVMDTGAGELGAMAQYRIAGKPYSISEYNHPAPNDFRVEMMPLYSAFGAAQDWDMLYVFDYGATGQGQVNDAIQGFFATATDPMKAAFFPAAALAFRQGLVPRLVGENLLSLPRQAWKLKYRAGEAWASTPGIKSPLNRRMAMGFQENATEIKLRRSVTDDVPSSLSVGKSPSGKVFTVDAPNYKSLVGFLSGGTFSLSEVSIAFPTTAQPFAALTLHPVDGKPFSASKRLLLTVAGRAENLNMGWNATRTSVSDQWGQGPVQAEGITATIAITSTRPRKVWALDPTGHRQKELKTSLENGSLSFKIGPEFKTLWYEIAD